MLNRIFSRKGKAKAAADEGQGSLLDLLEEEQGNVIDFPTGRPAEGSLLSTIDRSEIDAERARQMAHLEQHAEPPAAAHLSASNSEPVFQTRVEQKSAAPKRDQAQIHEQQEQLDLLSKELEDMASLMREQSGERKFTESPNSLTRPVHFHGSQADQLAPYTGQGGFDLLSFDKVAATVLRKWWLVATCGFFGACLAAIYALSLPNKYLSLAEILIEPRGVKVIENTVMPTELNSQATIAYAESQVRILTSSSVLDPVIEDLELADDTEFNGTAPIAGVFGQILRAIFGKSEDSRANFIAAKEYLYENIFVVRINQTFTIQIGVTTEEAAKSARIANAIARAYMNAETRAKSSAARNATEDLTGRLDELRALVRQSEEKVEAYKAENGLVGAEGKLVSEVQLARLNDQLAIVQAQVSDARSRAEQAAQADLSDVLSGALPTSLASPTVSQLRVAYSRAKSRLDRVSTKLGELHPERIAAQAELRSARQAIASELSRIVESAQEDYRSARARLADIRGQVNSLKAGAVEDSAAKVKLRELERDVQANRQVYESFLLRSRETGEQENIRTESARIITEATPSIEKDGPNRKLITLAGGAAGGLIGILLALLPLAASVLRQLVSGRETPMIDQQRLAYDDDLYTSHPSPRKSRQPAEPGISPAAVEIPLASAPTGEVTPGHTASGAVTREELEDLRQELRAQAAAAAQSQPAVSPPTTPQVPVHQQPVQFPLFQPPPYPVYAPPIYQAFASPVGVPVVQMPMPYNIPASGMSQPASYSAAAAAGPDKDGS